MKKMYIVRGLPGSGKSTLAYKLYRENNPSVVLSTDDLVTSDHHYLWSNEYLGLAHQLNQAKAKEACRRNLTVIIDNTNITAKEIQPYADTANEYGYSLHLVQPTNIWSKDAIECFKRNTHNVPLKTIQKMLSLFQSDDDVLNRLKLKDVVEKYIPLADKPECIICDLDGTLCDHTGIRSPYDGEKCDQDKCIDPVKDLLESQYEYQRFIILMSGREEKFKEKTQQWLDKHDIAYDCLFMRKTGDNRRDSIVKLELFNNHIRNKFNVKFVVDDRLQVIKECWRKLGLFVFNVNQDLKEF